MSPIWDKNGVLFEIRNKHTEERRTAEYLSLSPCSTCNFSNSNKLLSALRSTSQLFAIILAWSAKMGAPAAVPAPTVTVSTVFIRGPRAAAAARVGFATSALVIGDSYGERWGC